MDPREEIETLQGQARTGARPPTEGERHELLDRARTGRRQARWARLGYWLSPLVFIGILMALFAVPKGPMIVVVMAVGFTGLAWVLLSARDARQRAALSQTDAKARLVESYEIDGATVEALDTTGRVLRVGNERPEAIYATRRVVGLPHALVQDDRSLGPRRLSDAEKEEIDRMVARTRRRPNLAEVAIVPIAAIMLSGSMAMFRERGWGFETLVMPSICLFGVAANGLARLSLFRIRQALRSGKREGQVVGMVHEGRHIEIMAGKILWTVDGKPSELRTRWTP